MKQFISTIFISLITMALQAQPPVGEANTGDYYGAKTSARGAVNINTLPATLSKTDKAIDTKVKARVLEVCTNKGCWIKVAVDDETTAMVQMKDYGFFLPVAIVGKTIIIDGKAAMKTTSVEELKHYAEDAHKSTEEIAAITSPKKEMNLTAKGILVVAQ